MRKGGDRRHFGMEHASQGALVGGRGEVENGLESVLVMKMRWKVRAGEG